MSDVCPFEDHGFRGKSIQVGRVNFYPAVTCDRVRSLLVRKEQNQIGLSISSHKFQLGTKSALINFRNLRGLAGSFRHESWMARD
jgi:hypothetical protein